MRSVILVFSFLVLTVGWSSLLAHDEGDIPQKIVNSIPSVQVIAFEDAVDSYLLMLRNNSAHPLSRLEWRIWRAEEEKSGAAHPPEIGTVAPGSLFDVVIPRLPPLDHDDEELLQEGEPDPHLQTIVLEVALFVGGEPDGDSAMFATAKARQQGAILALGQAVSFFREAESQTSDLRAALNEAIQRLEGLNLSREDVPKATNSGLTEDGWDAAAVSDGFLTQIEALAVHLQFLTESGQDEKLIQEQLSRVIVNSSALISIAEQD